MRDFAKRFYSSKAWKDCRASYFAKVFGLCERCGAGGKIVHHKIYLNERNIHDVSVTLNHEQLELLCQECHNDEHMAKAPIASGLKFDESGQMVQHTPPVNKEQLLD